MTQEGKQGKSKVVAGFLGVFPMTGALGVHRFYLGNIGLGITHVCLLLFGILFTLTFIGALVGAPMLLGNLAWAIIEGIMIFAGAIKKDANGQELV